MDKDKILRGSDVAKTLGAPSYREFVIKTARGLNRKYTGKLTNQRPVLARIDYGRWLADCECGGAEYVDPDDPVFFCQSCGNASTDGKLRKVIFPEPEERKKIEEAVLERRVEVIPGLNVHNQALRAKSVDGIPRSWRPGESVEQLREQHEVAKLARARRQEVSNGV